jgi:mannose/fructose-specific phosphotransferase system component IIA
MTPLLLLTHGEFGPFLLKAAECMYGPQDAVAALALAPDETPESFGARIRAARAAWSRPPLVLVDMACGTPWNVAVSQGCTDGEVLAGLSLPLLLEAIGLRGSLEARPLAAELCARAPQSLVRASELLKGQGGCA